MTELLHPPLDSGPPWSQRVIEGIRALCPYHDGNRALGGSRARVERYRPLHDTGVDITVSCSVVHAF